MYYLASTFAKMRNLDLLTLSLVFSFGSRAIAHPSPNQAQEPRIPDPVSRPVSTIFASTGPTSSASYNSPYIPPSAAAAPVPHVVFFTQNATAEEISAVNSTLNRDAAPDSLSEVTKRSTGLVVFFKATISPSQADDIRRAPGVSGVFTDQIPQQEQPPLPAVQLSAVQPSASRDPSALGPRGSSKRSITNPTDVSLQTDAVRALKVVSQPPGAAYSDLAGYAYASEGGKGVTIYLMDTGANIENPEWYRMPGSKSFIFTPGVRQTEDDGPDNHGSCVASKAGSPVHGTAKNANIVAVKMPNYFPFSAIMAGLIEISNDVYEKNLEGKAVINMSFKNERFFLPGQEDIYMQLLVALMMEDIVIVCASGNDAIQKGQDLTHYPSVFGYGTNLIVVGAVDNWGLRAFYSQGRPHQLTVSAPDWTICPKAGSPGSQKLIGTSFAAPVVSGVIAVWLSQDQHKARLQVKGKVAENVKKMVKELAYPRMRGGPPVVWNGIDPRELGCPVKKPFCSCTNRICRGYKKVLKGFRG
ncbi:subtilisin-like protein [Colletotrichum zoysiae]|uniref:Subtilisin-like protein n=1 Tax=Colletotrichum zoysiae TaxID=1216348 RepID=A0AAD9HIU5_9PEZI|nr:subtilisin-like protein [Colletotrichum zoysiae]